MGFVIGKNGETIKRIQAETGAKVQFNMSKFLTFCKQVTKVDMYALFLSGKVKFCCLEIDGCFRIFSK